MFVSRSATSVSTSTHRLAQERSDSLVTAVVSPAGDSIVLEGFATVVFPAGAFEEPHSVTVSATQSPDMRVLLEAFTTDTLPIRPMLHEVRVNTGDLAPAAEVEVAVVVSEEFLGRLPEGHVPWAYVLLLSGGPLETLNNFWPFPNEYEPATRKLRVILGRSAFGDVERRPDGALEAVIMVGAVRGQQS